MFVSLPEFRSLDPIVYKTRDYGCAFLNSTNGILYFGITRDRALVGFPLSRQQRDKLRLLIDSVMGHMSPPAEPRLYRCHFFTVGTSSVVVLRIRRSSVCLHFTAADRRRALTMVGTRFVELGREQLIQRLRSTTLRPVEFDGKNLVGVDWLITRIMDFIERQH